jgi:hypothetical protein
VRRFAPPVVALVTMLVLASATAAASRPTTVHRFVAFQGGRVASGLDTVKQASGHCWTSSIADGRADAWRCFLGNLILDPCFSNGRSSQPYVVCSAAPWSTKVTLLSLTKRLPLSMANKGSHTLAMPWGIVTAGGKRCTAVTGTTSPVAGKLIRYYCRGGGVLAGWPDRRAPVWTISFARSETAHRLSTVAVAGVWS